MLKSFGFYCAASARQEACQRGEVAGSREWGNKKQWVAGTCLPHTAISSFASLVPGTAGACPHFHHTQWFLNVKYCLKIKNKKKRKGKESVWDPAGLPAAAVWLWSLNYITNSTTAPGSMFRATAHETRGLQWSRIKPFELVFPASLLTRRAKNQVCANGSIQLHSTCHDPSVHRRARPLLRNCTKCCAFCWESVSTAVKCLSPDCLQSPTPGLQSPVFKHTVLQNNSGELEGRVVLHNGFFLSDI